MIKTSRNSSTAKVIALTVLGLAIPIMPCVYEADSQQEPNATSPESLNVGCDGVSGSGKVMKACGCDLPAGPCGCSPCAPVPTTSPTHTPTCGVFIGEVTAHPDSSDAQKSFNEIFPPPANGAPSCLTAMRDKISRMADDLRRADPSHTQYIDDYVSIWFMDELRLRSSVFYSPQRATTSVCSPACAPGAPARIPACWCDADGYNNFATSTQPPSPSPIECLSRAPVGQLGYEHWEGLCVNYKVYLDKDCKVVPPSLLGNLRQCSGVDLSFWPSSPISLMWGTNRAINSRGTLVKFPLDKARADSWYTWYGSEETPLLVYDPAHKGQVTSADQLFGNWTFGGKRVAALTSESSAHAAPWRDGYEALETLDNNGDGEISGKELEPLALWFDRGGDAVAGQGEVVPVSKVGLKKLFVGPREQDQTTRNVHVKRGFARATTTGEEFGESVDWYGTGAASQADLIVKQLTLTERERALTDISALLPQRPVSQGSGSTKPPHLSLVKDSPATGAWFWKASEDSQEASRGVILIDHVVGDSVTGMSVSEIPVRDTSGKLRSLLSTKVITGTITRESDETYKISFSTVTAPDPMGKRQPPSVSEARLSIKDKTLRGETTELLGPNTKMTYSWVASK